MGKILRHLLMLLVAITVFTGIVVPLMVTGIARVLLQDAERSVIQQDGRCVDPCPTDPLR